MSMDHWSTITMVSFINIHSPWVKIPGFNRQHITLDAGLSHYITDGMLRVYRSGMGRDWFCFLFLLCSCLSLLCDSNRAAVKRHLKSVINTYISCFVEHNFPALNGKITFNQSRNTFNTFNARDTCWVIACILHFNFVFLLSNNFDIKDNGRKEPKPQPHHWFYKA